MDIKNIPLKEKFDGLVKGLAEIMPLAEELSRDPVHSQSPHIAGLLSRVRGGIESADWHVKFLANLPEAVQPKTKTATDAKAGATGN